MGHSEGNAVNRVEGLDKRLMNGTTNQPADGPDRAETYDEAVRWLMAFDSVTGRLLLPGYPALVRALSQNLDKLAVLIAEDLTQI